MDSHYLVSMVFLTGKDIKKSQKKNSLLGWVDCTFCKVKSFCWFGQFLSLPTYKTTSDFFFILGNKDCLLYQSVVIFNHHFWEKDQWKSPVIDRICKIWTNLLQTNISWTSMPSVTEIQLTVRVKLKKAWFCLLPYMVTGGHFGSCDQFFLCLKVHVLTFQKMYT